jgi:hypothetical protein
MTESAFPTPVKGSGTADQSAKKCTAEAESGCVCSLDSFGRPSQKKTLAKGVVRLARIFTSPLF